jgi:hypothetical protein
MKGLIPSLLLTATLAAAQGSRTFMGTITDSECGEADHSRMRMGTTDAECAIACVAAHAALFVLYDGKVIYMLSDQLLPEKFAGQHVAVTGSLDARTMTINVESISSAK